MNSSHLDNFWSRMPKAVSRLGCETEAERLAALAAVDRLLKGQDLSYLDLSDRIWKASPPAAARFDHCSPAPSFGDMARACRDLDRGRLADREHAFVVDMVRRGFSFRPTPRQSAWLSDIFDKLNERAAA